MWHPVGVFRSAAGLAKEFRGIDFHVTGKARTGAFRSVELQRAAQPSVSASVAETVTLEMALARFAKLSDAELDAMVERNIGGYPHMAEIRLLIEDAITAAAYGTGSPREEEQ
jgi:hypothetical protein